MGSGSVLFVTPGTYSGSGSGWLCPGGVFSVLAETWAGGGSGAGGEWGPYGSGGSGGQDRNAWINVTPGTYYPGGGAGGGGSGARSARAGPAGSTETPGSTSRPAPTTRWWSARAGPRPLAARGTPAPRARSPGTPRRCPLPRARAGC